MDESGKIDPHIIKKYANVLIDEEILARIELLRETNLNWDVLWLCGNMFMWIS
jgi:hypothetical protein